MSEQSPRFRHIYLPKNGKREDYTRPPSGGGKSIEPPERNRPEHAQNLERQIGAALQNAQRQLNSRDANIAAGEPGFYLEFKVQTDQAKAFEQLENRTKKIELVTVKKIPEQETMVTATVFVPERSSDHFLKKVEKYRDEDDARNGKPKNQKLVTRIEEVQLAQVESLYTDDLNLFPEDGRYIWWEVWLRKERRQAFEYVIQGLNIQSKEHSISFPERDIVLVMSNIEGIAQIIKNSDSIAELRIAKDNPSIFLEMGSLEQSAWADDLSNRLLEPGDYAVSVCLLDSGITPNHPLIIPGLKPEDLHTVEPSWGVGDSSSWQGHGTAMGGIALYTDLSEVLAMDGDIKLFHRLESVKILPPHGENDPELYGAITEQGVARPEIQAPDRRRVFCMAVTSNIPNPNIGTPSSWSAAIDQLCFNNDGEFRRLLIISAGNIRDAILSDSYISSNNDYLNDIHTVENPGQSWNALVVGAYTEKINIIHPDFLGWQPLAPCGDISPSSRTSVNWSHQWPIRPDVVFEGGNMAHNGQDPAQPIDDLCLLTTYYRPNVRIFEHMRDTSCAAALASYMAARIMTEYPTFSPETIRALIVHSADWTPAMRTHFDSVSNKSAKRALIRRYGYGVPDLDRALRSARNSLTLITEDKLQPFCLDGTVKTKDMKLHNLPWPKEKLEELGEVDVKLKVTLSYFIEPNPGERGWAYKHRYASYGLRFEVKRSLENINDFRWRISEAIRKEEGGIKTKDKYVENWFLGPNTRDNGSLHCDIWEGSAAELSQRDSIAVYPVGGWWKEKRYLQRYEQSVNYSLIISINVPEVEVDIYTPVANQVGITIPNLI